MYIFYWVDEETERGRGLGRFFEFLSFEVAFVVRGRLVLVWFESELLRYGCIVSFAGIFGSSLRGRYWSILEREVFLVIAVGINIFIEFRFEKKFGFWF